MEQQAGSALRAVYIVGLVAVAVLGGIWLLGLLILPIAIALVADLAAGEDVGNGAPALPLVLDLALYLALPALWIMLAAYFFYIGSGDPFHVAALVRHVTGYDMVAARSMTPGWVLVLATIGMGMNIAGTATVPAHELTHRTADAMAMLTGRLLLALSFDAGFTIEHVHGHHLQVCLHEDPTTARRGESFYAYFPRSVIGQIRSAWSIEGERLRRLGVARISLRNRMLQNYVPSLIYLSLAAVAAGVRGVLAYAAIVVIAKLHLELTNYIEHYGLVREPGRPVQLRHAWNTHSRISSWLLFNLTRHSDHHWMATRRFYEIEARPQTPMLPHGYLAMHYIALVPHWFRAVMAPRIADWDSRLATPAERRIAAADEAVYRRAGAPVPVP